MPEPSSVKRGVLTRLCRGAPRRYLRAMRSPARRVLSAIGRGLLSPPVVGAVYLFAIVVRASTTPLVSDDKFTPGPEAKALADLIAASYGGDLFRFGLRLAAVTLACGAALGTLGALLGDLRDRAAGRPPPALLGRAARALAGAAALHAWAMAWTMARKPQPFADAWYAEGGAWRAAQILVTDRLGPGAIAAIGAAAIVAYVAGSRARLGAWARWARAARPSRIGAASLAVAAAAWLWPGCATTAPPQPSVRGAPGADPDRAPPADGRPSVLLLAADGLRVDRLGPRVTPRLAAFAEAATRFDRAYVPIPHTVPSWVSILTGRDPHHHGVRSIFPRFEERARDLDALPARLARAGYFTAVVADFAGEGFHDLDLGWAAIDAPSLDFPGMLCQRALEHAPPLLPLLDTAVGARLFPAARTMNTMSDPRDVAAGVSRALRAAGGRPFFVTAFFSTSHFPYAAPAPYYARFTDPRYRGPFKYHRPVGLAREPEPGAEDLAQIRGLYDGAAASVDDAIGAVLAELDRLGLSGRTIVIVTSDHGEALFEHGRGIGHGDHLFGDDVAHVPLLLRDPRRPGARREPALVRTVDIAPTIYALTGVDPAPALDGRSLAGALDGPIAGAPAYAETDLWLGESAAVPPELRLPYPGFAGLLEIDTRHGHEIVVRDEWRLRTVIARHRMIHDGRWKLIYAPTPAGARYFLYDTREDPEEIHDRAADRPEEVARLRELLWAWMVRDPELAREGDALVPGPGARASGDPPGLRLAR
jgi:arylsulfatase A-like enzyme